MKMAQENLTKASHKLAEAMYKSAGPQGGPEPGGPAPGDAQAGPGKEAKDNVVHAEFVDVDDDKNKKQ